MKSTREALTKYIKKAKKEHGDSLVRISISSEFHANILNSDNEDVDGKWIEGIEVIVDNYQKQEIKNILAS